MIKVRDGFETNSSSSHSVVISDVDNAFTDLSYLGQLEFGGKTLHVEGETRFGWEWEIWSMPGDKLNYILIDNDNDELVRERLVNLIKEKTGVEHVDFPDFDNAPEYGAYVDHQSSGTSQEVLRLDDDELWRFIMNPESAFRGGNDNDEGPWSTYYDEVDDD